MNIESNHSQRILWIDIFKALSIILVVLGHATGLFNMYIYQFHLAAFFFISGYVAKHDSDNIIILLIKRIYTLLLPTFSLLLLNYALMATLNHFGKYQNWFGNLSYISFHDILEQFFKYGRIYAWLLGGAWFLIVLFIITIMARLIWYISNKNIHIYFAFTILIYILGYLCISKNQLNEHYPIDLCLIAQFFYSIGYIVKHYCNNTLSCYNKKIILPLILTSTLIMLYCGTLKNVAIDYTARSFHNILLNTFTCINGIIWLYCLSILIAQLHNIQCINLFTNIGQNTLGILLLHFGLFKLTFILLYIMKLIPATELANITPSSNVGNHFFWLFVLISISLGTLIWKTIKKIPILSFLIGSDKRILLKLNQISNTISKSFNNKNLMQKINHFIISKQNLFKKLSILLLLGCYIITIQYFAYELYLSYSPLDIWFPNELTTVSFEDGWLDQSNENYRWIEGEGTIVFHHRRHNSITIEGYVPEDFSEVTNLDILVNGKKVSTINTKETPHFGETIDIKDYIKSSEFEITFAFNGIHPPAPDSADPRSLSGLISHIYIE